MAPTRRTPATTNRTLRRKPKKTRVLRSDGPGSTEVQPAAIDTVDLPSMVRSAIERNEFGADGNGIVWAVVSTGVDSEHPHFSRHRNLDLPHPLRHWDFTDPTSDPDAGEMEAKLDAHGFGTHLAGLIAGIADESTTTSMVVDWEEIQDDGSPQRFRSSLPSISGHAPLCKILSLKVLGDDGGGKVSNLIRALQWIREINAAGTTQRVHGVALGLAYPYDHSRYATGQTPLCVAVNELVSSGVVVVASAGNSGIDRFLKAGGNADALGMKISDPVSLGMSISDPGNAEDAITVGATSGHDPVSFGVSYYSSRGPTSDGRAKPDLVAAAERVISCAPLSRRPPGAPGRGVAPYSKETGTSVAVGTVSGLIAALLSCRRSLIGRPRAVKRLLLSTALDLGRDRYAQGCGVPRLREALALSASDAWPTATDDHKSESRAQTPHLESVVATAPTDVTVSTPTGVGAKHPEGPPRFRVAVSYPGERREYVSKVVYALRRLGIGREEIFYDRFHEAMLVGPNLDARLQRIYRDESELVVVFISAEYESKEWCGLEWRAIRDILKKRRDSDVVPLRFDDTEVPGLFSIDGHVDVRERDPEEIADLIHARLEMIRVRR